MLNSVTLEDCHKIPMLFEFLSIFNSIWSAQFALKKSICSVLERFHNLNYPKACLTSISLTAFALVKLFISFKIWIQSRSAKMDTKIYLCQWLKHEINVLLFSLQINNELIKFSLAGILGNLANLFKIIKFMTSSTQI